MIDIGTGRRPAADLSALLDAADNQGVSAPAPANALFLDHVAYPSTLYLSDS